MIVLSPIEAREFLKAKYTKRWRGKDGKWHYEYAMPGVATSKDAFTPVMLAKLKAEYSTLKTIDPASPTYKKLTAKLDAMSTTQLKQIVDAKIPFIAGLARNRVMKREPSKKAETFSEADVANWVKNIAPYVQKHIEQGLDKETAMASGMADYQATLKEMAAQKTPRSQAAVKKMAGEAHTDIRRSSIKLVKPVSMPKDHPALKQARAYDKKHKGAAKFRLVDVTPKGYGPNG